VGCTDGFKLGNNDGDALGVDDRDSISSELDTMYALPLTFATASTSMLGL
jgi:hypothetical protein